MTNKIPIAIFVFFWFSVPALEKKKTIAILRAGSNYAQVERRSITILDQTMSRGEAFGLKKYIKKIHLKPLAL